ncbi:hypothetical protein XENORESO_013813 [Xenotaenia resolanae]|uniref:Uncharacterized protein n=1 Tax=Xenotaenia resolanae TaxID=208358 RepID=A0ABV0WZ09_9TELE
MFSSLLSYLLGFPHTVTNSILMGVDKPFANGRRSEKDQIFVGLWSPVRADHAEHQPVQGTSRFLGFNFVFVLNELALLTSLTFSAFTVKRIGARSGDFFSKTEDHLLKQSNPNELVKRNCKKVSFMIDRCPFL